ncbi:hypothetical protein GCM10007242_44450 [Pigmentiphaga litoralis]|uniref:DNA-binding protein n=1 Tax=Pigmentiphaga litoralis TaxID=516702 RepID=UPI00167A89A6|nr:DNA-binding protein [Pigmentiphaga litoralis]GGX32628.1 hypothetical protein GCM10007242_44450 [Pigmentiphaga litoralis]
MNAIVEAQTRRPSIERALRHLLTNPSSKTDAREALGMDDSQVSRFLSGQAGIPIDKIDRAIQVAGMVLVRPDYLKALSHLADTGVNCACALAGGGNCGGKW